MDTEEYARMASAEDHMWWYCGLHEWLLDRMRSFSLSKCATVLDCGAGTGGFSRKLGEQFPGIEIFGVDASATAVKFYAERARRNVVRGSVNELGFADDCFDVVVCADLLYHSGVDEQAAIRELFRCTRPGGTVLLNLPAYSWMKSSHDKPIHTARRYTASGAANRMRQAGFHIREATYRNSLLFPIMTFWRLTIGRFSKTSDVSAFPAWQEFLFGRVIGFENALARRGVRFPFGGSVYVQAIKPSTGTATFRAAALAFHSARARDASAPSDV